MSVSTPMLRCAAWVGEFQSEVTVSGCPHLTREERDRIAEFHSEGLGCSATARRLGRSASTISHDSLYETRAVHLVFGKGPGPRSGECWEAG
ncbi:MAG: helix-turn-helix domain-containing protein, partial [Rubricoccaceae bacterium]|nr:helix-turn-helix domain-containing protein [Rubricoccaceae bacterium]